MRNLTLEGKSLILKTFGILQLIYNMQSIKFEKEHLTLVERAIFGFLWGSKELDSRARDRVKRSIMKNDYDKGGLKITDIECLDKALKLKQYIRANRSRHNISNVQKFCSEARGNKFPLAQEFNQIADQEDVCNIAQKTLNSITDYNREKYFQEDKENITSTIAINQIAATNIETYLRRKGKKLAGCLYLPLKREGIETYLELVSENEIVTNNRTSDNINNIINAFPKYFKDAANSFDENINSQSDEITHIQSMTGEWIKVAEITTKDLQVILKVVMEKLEEIDVDTKNKVTIRDSVDILEFRRNCKNPKLRNIYFRLLHDDFYSHERMFRYRMTESANCPRCGETETSRHMLWGCRESRNIWKIFNEILNDQNIQFGQVNIFEDLFATKDLKIVSVIKMKIINEMIQIVRPTGWNKDRLIKIIKRLKNIEIYNATKLNKKNITEQRWEIFKHL
jgi:hypothetical protein